MNKIIKKSFSLCEYEKVEKWLNQIAADGLTVISTKNDCFFINCDGKYEFAQSEKGEFKIAMLLLDEKHTSTESKKQIEFIEETGAHFVGMFDKWAIFRKQSKYGEFKLLSDKPSQIKNITNIMKRLTIKFVLYLVKEGRVLCEKTVFVPDTACHHAGSGNSAIWRCVQFCTSDNKRNNRSFQRAVFLL